MQQRRAQQCNSGVRSRTLAMPLLDLEPSRQEPDVEQLVLMFPAQLCGVGVSFPPILQELGSCALPSIDTIVVVVAQMQPVPRWLLSPSSVLSRSPAASDTCSTWKRKRPPERECFSLANEANLSGPRANSTHCYSKMCLSLSRGLIRTQHFKTRENHNKSTRMHRALLVQETLLGQFSRTSLPPPKEHIFIFFFL